MPLLSVITKIKHAFLVEGKRGAKNRKLTIAIKFIVDIILEILLTPLVSKSVFYTLHYVVSGGGTLVLVECLFLIVAFFI